MPLSEEEQRILHEMEKKLYEQDRSSGDRGMRMDGQKSLANRALRWSIVIFLAGLLIILFSFQSSLLLGTFGFLVMLFAAVLFERSARQVYLARNGADPAAASAASRSKAFTDELTLIGRRFRSRFLRDR